MKQPPLKHTGCPDWSQWSKIDEERSRLANFWNLSKRYLDDFSKTFDSYKFRKEPIPNETCEALCYYLRNIEAHLHNLGQQLVRIEGIDYDWDKAEVPSWMNPDKTIYSHPTKTMKIVKK